MAGSRWRRRRVYLPVAGAVVGAGALAGARLIPRYVRSRDAAASEIDELELERELEAAAARVAEPESEAELAELYAPGEIPALGPEEVVG